MSRAFLINSAIVSLIAEGDVSDVKRYPVSQKVRECCEYLSTYSEELRDVDEGKQREPSITRFEEEATNVFLMEGGR